MNLTNGFNPPEGSWEHLQKTAFIEFSSPRGGILAHKLGKNPEFQEKVNKAYREYKEKLQSVEGANITFDDEKMTFRFHHHDTEVKAIAKEAGILDRFPKFGSVLDDPLSITFGRRGKEELSLTIAGYNNFHEWEKECYEKADLFFKQYTFPDVEVETLPEEKILSKKLLKDYEGFCIGEFHNDSNPKRYLIENMAKLKEKGVRTLYMEHLFYDSMQTCLDESLARKDKKLPPYLKRCLKQMDAGYQINDLSYGYLELVKAALKNGIRVVGIDTTGSYLCGTHRKNGVVNSKQRYSGMNFIASQIMQHEQQKEQAGKYVALMGKYHILQELGIPGVSEIMHVPAVSVEESMGSLQLRMESPTKAPSKKGKLKGLSTDENSSPKSKNPKRKFIFSPLRIFKRNKNKKNHAVPK